MHYRQSVCVVLTTYNQLAYSENRRECGTYALMLKNL